MKSFFFGLFAISGLFLSSCNTTIGLGRDMRILGSEMERKADATYNGGDGTNATDDYGGAPVY